MATSGGRGDAPGRARFGKSGVPQAGAVCAGGTVLFKEGVASAKQGSEGAGRRPRRLQLGAGSERGGVLGRGLKGQGLVIGLGSHLAGWKGPGTLEPQTGVRPQPLGSSVGPDPGE